MDHDSQTPVTERGQRFPRAVGRAVVDDEATQVGVRLAQHRAGRLDDEVAPVVSRDDHRDCAVVLHFSSCGSGPGSGSARRNPGKVRRCCPSCEG